MANEDFAASLRASARTEDEYKSHIEEHARKAEEQRIKEENEKLYSSFADKFKQIIQKSLSEGKFKIETANGKRKVFGEIYMTANMYFNWDETDRGRNIRYDRIGYPEIISNLGIKCGSLSMPSFCNGECINSGEGSRFLASMTSPKVQFVETRETKQALDGFLFNVNQRLDGVAKITDTGKNSIKYIERKYSKKGVNYGKINARDISLWTYKYELSRTLSFTVEF